MNKNLFSGEFEFKCPPKRVFPYLNTPDFISQWLVEDVYTANGNKNLFYFSWDNEEYPVKMTHHKTNVYVKYEFVNKKKPEPQSYIEFRLDKNELTHSTFLTVVDYSELQSQEEFQHFWSPLIERLRQLVGG